MTWRTPYIHQILSNVRMPEGIKSRDKLFPITLPVRLVLEDDAVGSVAQTRSVHLWEKKKKKMYLIFCYLHDAKP
ncbi:hypothetical protein XENTR_v10016505 [Xenopus tropicalis]|nr:hypothetical protein XENTR_v10016505 [Xenopus tropicalis]